MKNPRYSLFAKFSIGITLSVALFGILNILIVKKSVTETLNNELDKRGYFIARTVAEQAVPFLLSENSVGLNKLINEIHDIDSSIYYIFLVNSKNEVIAHSFNHSFPSELIKANYIKDDDKSNTVLIRPKGDNSILVKDFAMPVLSKNIGIVRVGVLENKINNEVNHTVSILLFMVLLFISLGIIGALFFSYIIATPLKFLSKKSETIDINSIQTGMQQIIDAKRNIFFRIRKVFNTDDEIDILFDKFISMLERLEHTQHKLNLAQQSLLQSEKMASIGILTAGIAHEINNPLAGIKNCLQRIAKKADDAEQTKKYVELMREALLRIENVVQDLLSFSRKSHLEFNTENIGELINKTVQLAKYRIGNKNISIYFNKTDINLYISANRIGQVILNIIINAIDAIGEKLDIEPHHEGKIKIMVNDSENHIIIEVHDNGTGINKEAVNNIFDPFFTTKKVGLGSGLGLSICYQIVKDHEGEIWVESSVGQGSVFFIQLPKKAPLDITNENSLTINM